MEIADFIKTTYLKRKTSFVKPRTMIRDYIQILDVKCQNLSRSIKDILETYKFAVDEEQVYDDFSD